MQWAKHRECRPGKNLSKPTERGHWKCSVKKRDSDKKYSKTEKGKQKDKRWLSSDRGRLISAINSKRTRRRKALKRGEEQLSRLAHERSGFEKAN